eukprot:TRINITY_DN80867_c0_g1_i1.p2 TRINITY_DN80867_c0_g1~~TRINITY_DN80867_c0_g1_i1.p2  ORF type:complete len:118 (-),score=5.26 TRINITY_DN80867_c0_g1_i1:231-584(-)
MHCSRVHVHGNHMRRKPNLRKLLYWVAVSQHAHVNAGDVSASAAFWIQYLDFSGTWLTGQGLPCIKRNTTIHVLADENSFVNRVTSSSTGSLLAVCMASHALRVLADVFGGHLAKRC